MDRRVKPGDDGLSPRGGATIKPAAEMGFSMPASDTSDKPPQAEPALRAIAMPADANPHGYIFGGWLLSQMDLAGGAAARRRAKGRTVTVAITAMTFHRPVFVGDEVSCYAEIIKVGKTSVTVKVESWVRRGIGDEHIPVTEGIFTYVAVGEDRRPRPVPPEG
jgi:acyl-CoA thioesterase YciA